MLTREGCELRRKRLFAQFSDPPEFVLIFDPQHLIYFANYYQSPFVFRSANASAALILGNDGSSVLVCDNQLKVFAEEAYVDEIVAPAWYRGRETAPPRRLHLLKNVLARLSSCTASHFGYEAACVPAEVLDQVRSSSAVVVLTPIDAAIHELKRSKDADELEIMKRSIQAQDAAFDGALKNVRPGMTEFGVYRLVQDTAQQTLGEAVTVYGDFVSGPRCQSGGGPPSHRVIESGDLVLIDFSVIVRGYRGDCANTFVCGRAPNEDELRLYDACLEAMRVGEGMIRAGQSCRELDQAIRDSLAARHLAENFTSHAGHGLGLGHPDPPYIVPASTDELRAGDIITLEPGQYIKGLAGVRYERTYLVTPSGYEVLSHLTLNIQQPT